MEPIRTKEKRQIQEHMKKWSGAGDEGGTSLSHAAQWRQ